jgi:hypothetical protein
MFVRFRQVGRRLKVSLVETRRTEGKVRHEHIAGLGSVVIPFDIPERIAFWRKLHERLARLANRIGSETQGKILGQVHGRIPMPTVDEMRALQSKTPRRTRAYGRNCSRAMTSSWPGKSGFAMPQRKRSPRTDGRQRTPSDTPRLQGSGWKS